MSSDDYIFCFEKMESTYNNSLLHTDIKKIWKTGQNRKKLI
ncbi:integrase domain protein [Streptococcus pneumoniae GA04216]|nr:integrase domain protein [Streptococcus pneumoniae GA04216]